MKEMNNTKKCTQCKENKPATKECFYRNKLCKLGLDTTCKECMKARSKKWEQENKNRKRIRQNNYRKKRRDEDSSFRTMENLRKRTWDALNGNSKSTTTVDMLSCSIRDFLKHLESQFTPSMNWNNQGGFWHIDHIIPCGSFDLSKPLEQKKCFNYRNMRPLEAKENKEKGDTLDLKLVEEYSISHLLPAPLTNTKDHR